MICHVIIGAFRILVIQRMDYKDKVRTYEREIACMLMIYNAERLLKIEC